MQGILISTFNVVLNILNYKYFDQYMASKLYKIKKRDDTKIGEKEFPVKAIKKRDYFQRSNFFKPTKLGNLRLYLMDILPSRCVCCKRSREEIGIQKALD